MRDAILAHNRTALRSRGSANANHVWKGRFCPTIWNGVAQPFHLLTEAESKYQKHMINVLNARQEMQRFDAERVISTSLSRNVRLHTTRRPDMGSAIHVAENGKRTVDGE